MTSATRLQELRDRISDEAARLAALEATVAKVMGMCSDLEAQGVAYEVTDADLHGITIDFRVGGGARLVTVPTPSVLKVEEMPCAAESEEVAPDAPPEEPPVVDEAPRFCPSVPIVDAGRPAPALGASLRQAVALPNPNGFWTRERDLDLTETIFRGGAKLDAIAKRLGVSKSDASNRWMALWTPELRDEGLAGRQRLLTALRAAAKAEKVAAE